MVGVVRINKGGVSILLRLLPVKILIGCFLLVSFSVSHAKPIYSVKIQHKLVFDNGVLVSNGFVRGRVNGKVVAFKLSKTVKILIKSYCYTNCDKEFIYKKVSLNYFKVKSKDKKDSVLIDDPVIVVLNRFGFVGKIIILRMPE